MPASRHLIALITAALLLGACGNPGPRTSPATIAQPAGAPHVPGNEIALYALGLIDTGYRFGGKNPEAGLDCSGMVSFIYREAAGLDVQGSAADIARRSREIDPRGLRPGDLVFFNTRHHAYSHVGIYIGDGRFVHAPSTNGRVRIDHLHDRYYAQRFEAAHSLID